MLVNRLHHQIHRRGNVIQILQQRGPLQSREMVAEGDQDLPVWERIQMRCPMRYRQVVIRVRQGHPATRDYPRKRQIVSLKILPRKPLQLLRPPPLLHSHQARPPPLQHRHQALRLQRRQLCRPPAHRHVFAKSTAASAALRGCVPRWCSPHPRWRTPLWAEEVCAGCACQHSTAGICARVLLPDVLNKRNNDCVLLHLLLLPCCALRVVAPRIYHVKCIPDKPVCTTSPQLFAWTHVCVLARVHCSHSLQLCVFCVFTF
ncbi:hypothetical protein TCDM_13289 [Trypanosoma cruzi Dm28c]|uniref:Mucin TcMUCII n=1 Tax=Trypanosoma cruzi Dm28c TaxID=1416333 RepID=V5A396_TRYCR|nr:hypothetical protein TCDM_13289 [Trypanosoma cruzi Dm28c]